MSASSALPVRDIAPVGGARYRYRAFDLTIDSDLCLPELEAGDPGKKPDLHIRLRSMERQPPDKARSIYQYGVEDQYLYWPQVGAFLISGADTIDIDPAPEASDGLLRLPLLGPVMALLLHMRGALVLHASAVCVGDRLAVFLGDKGAGKSTTTAAALERGHTLFTDDLLAVTIGVDGTPRAAPGFPSVKLVTDCAGMFDLGGAPELAAPTADFPKRIRRVGARFPDKPMEFGGLYILSRGEKAEITPLATDEALRMIMRFAYVPLFDRKPWTPDETRRHFTQCAGLASAARVARLETPSDLARMSEIIACVEDDLAVSAP